MPPALEDVLRLCTALTPSRLRQLLRLAHNRPNPSAVLYWTADLLYQRRIPAPEDVPTVLQHFQEDLDRLQLEFDTAMTPMPRPAPAKQSVPAALLVFHDRRWVRGVMRERAESFFDLETGQTVPELPLPSVEILAYDLTVVYLRNWKMLERHDHAAS